MEGVHCFHFWLFPTLSRLSSFLLVYGVLDNIVSVSIAHVILCTFQLNFVVCEYINIHFIVYKYKFRIFQHM